MDKRQQLITMVEGGNDTQIEVVFTDREPTPEDLAQPYSIWIT